MSHPLGTGDLEQGWLDYFIPGTSILRNRVGAQTVDELRNAENDLVEALNAGRWPSRSVSASVPSTSKITALRTGIVALPDSAGAGSEGLSEPIAQVV